MTTKLIGSAVLSLLLMGGVGVAEAGQRQRGGGGGGGGSVGRAVPRSGGVAGSPRGVVGSPRGVGRSYYRPYYGSRFGLSIYGGYPYGYYPYGYGYPYGYYGYGYGYPYGYGGYYGYGGGGYGYGYRESAYGGVRITDAPRDAAVYADGYYVGTVDDFDGTFQRLDLEAGSHHIEIMPQGQQPIAFDVNIRPGQTITYRADR
jgi:hypothetical protein